MSVNITLKIGKIAGESVVKNHAGEIDVLDWSWGITQKGSAHHGTGAGSGASDVADLVIVKRIDKATPIFYQECHKGSDQKEAVLTLMKVAGESSIEYLKITMKGPVFISSVKTGNKQPDDSFTETVSFNFAEVSIDHTGQNKDQSKGATSTGTLNIAGR